MTVAESSATAQPWAIPLREDTVKTNMKTLAEINVHGRNPERLNFFETWHTPHVASVLEVESG